MLISEFLNCVREQGVHNGLGAIRVPRAALLAAETGTMPWLRRPDVVFSHKYYDDAMELPDLILKDEFTEEQMNWTVWADPMGYPTSFRRGEGILPYLSARKVLTIYPRWYLGNAHAHPQLDVTGELWPLLMFVQSLLVDGGTKLLMRKYLEVHKAIMLDQDVMGGKYSVTLANYDAVLGHLEGANMWTNILSYDRMWMLAERTACAVVGNEYLPARGTEGMLTVDLSRMLLLMVYKHTHAALGTLEHEQHAQQLRDAENVLSKKWITSNDFSDIITVHADKGPVAFAAHIIRNNLLLTSATLYRVDAMYVEVFLAYVLSLGVDGRLAMVDRAFGQEHAIRSIQDAAMAHRRAEGGHLTWGAMAAKLALESPCVLAVLDDKASTPSYSTGQSPVCGLGLLGVMPLGPAIVQMLIEQ
jgi:hypothetical protein